ncbi:MAG: peptidylprolyl isomerase, partial [Gammaproteobacteria bacterium]|nr:peptidylprolyl isomerase [Gammaproteobacteria bacterium]
VDRATLEEPFLFTIGDGSLIEGLERLLIGQRAGEKNSYLVAASEAFGERDPEQIHTLPREQFDQAMVLEPGCVVTFEAPSGDEVAATVVALDEEKVEVDFSHPLAGRDLQFEVELISVDGAAEGEA